MFVVYLSTSFILRITFSNHYDILNQVGTGLFDTVRVLYC